MGKAIVEFNSGQRNRYSCEVAPLERRLRRNGKVNWAICLVLLAFPCIGGVVIGFFIVPTFLGMFAGLLGGTILGVLLLLGYYFLRSAFLTRTKNRVKSGISSCEAAYREAYEIPENAVRCEILASSFLSKNYFGPSLIYKRDSESISIVSSDYKTERNEIRYSADSVIAYSLFADSRVLVQSKEGYVLLPPNAKDFFVITDLPLFRMDSKRLFEILGTSFRASARSLDHVNKNETMDNPSWLPARHDLEEYLEKEGSR